MNRIASSLSLHRPWLGRIRPCVVDANFVLNNVLYGARRHAETAVVRAARAGTTRLFAAPHIFEEVNQHLPERAKRAKVPLRAASSEWREVYRPLIWRVDTSGFLANDTRVAYVGARDRDDVPTAILALLLSPSHCLSEDFDLVDAGLGTREWLPLTLAAAAEANTDEAHGFAALSVAATWMGTEDLIRALWRHPGGRVVLGVGAGVAVLFVVRLLREETNPWRGRLKAAGRFVLEEYRGLAERNAQAQETLRATEITTMRHLDVQRIARLLAVSRCPLTATEIARALSPLALKDARPRAAVRWILRLLEQNTAFVSLARSRWQLGQQPDSRELALRQ